MSKHYSGRKRPASHHSSSSSLERATGGAQEVIHEEHKDQRISGLEKRVRELETENKKLRIDAITGIPTRTAFRLDLQQRLEKPMDNAMIVVIDLKSMKWINDTFSHKAGDNFLREVGGRIKDIFSDREDSPLRGRIGGDEFVIFIPNPSDEEEEVLQDYISYLFDDKDDLNDGCWLTVNDEKQALLRGRYAVRGIKNGDLTPDGIREIYEEMDKSLTLQAEEDQSRGKPTKVRSLTTPR